MDQIKNWMENSIVDEILLFAVLIAVIESFAQNTLKTSENGSLKFAVGLFIYSIVGYILYYAYHKFPLGKMNVMWSCFSIIFAITIGFFLYDEKIDHWIILSGLLALTAIFCSYMSESK